MRQLKMFLAVVVLAIAACRSVPADVRQAHDTSMVESKAALVIATDTLAKIETRSTELNDATVLAAYKEWISHISVMRDARGIVALYLAESKAGPDVEGPYSVGLRLVTSMDRGFAAINQHWAAMIDPLREDDAKVFLALFRKDIERFKVLERKFDEWIKQFRVKE